MKEFGEWQPIENVPEGGTYVIGYGKFPKDKDYQCFIAYYSSGGYTEGWAEKYSGQTLYLDFWMPLPKPPQPETIITNKTVNLKKEGELTIEESEW